MTTLIPNIISAGIFLLDRGCEKLCILGFGMGGALTIATCAATNIFHAAVSLYGVPELEKVNLAHIANPILCIFGEEEKNKEFGSNVPKLEDGFKKGNVKGYQIKVYDNADQGFANPDSKNYHDEESKLAIDDAINWCKAVAKAGVPLVFS